MLRNKIMISGMIIFMMSSCANKLFPDKKLYQYPEKSGDMAVVYPDGSVHHSNGTTTKDYSLPALKDTPPADNNAVEISNPTLTLPKDTEHHQTSEKGQVNTSAKKDATGRHARHRND